MKDYNVKVNINIEGDYVVSATFKKEAIEKVLDVISKLNLSKLGNVDVCVKVGENDE